jgi:hypothetical protein
MTVVGKMLEGKIGQTVKIDRGKIEDTQEKPSRLLDTPLHVNLFHT